MLVDVGFQDWVEVLEFDVANKRDYKYLVIDERRKLYQSQGAYTHIVNISDSQHFILVTL